MDATKVTAAKPKVGGAVYHAVSGSTLPITASATLDAAFADLGYISSDGVKNGTEMTVENVKAWGGDVVLASENGKVDTFTMKFIEGTNIEVLKTVYNSGNVEGALATGITVKANSTEHSTEVFVIDTVLKGNAVKRIVIPQGKVTALSEIQYVDNAPVGYEVTITALPYSVWSGDTHREYILAASSGTSGESGTSA